MKLLEEDFGIVRIFSDRPYGYKRYHVLWEDGREQTFNGLWYKRKDIVEKIKRQADIEEYVNGSS